MVDKGEDHRNRTAEKEAESITFAKLASKMQSLKIRKEKKDLSLELVQERLQTSFLRQTTKINELL